MSVFNSIGEWMLGIVVLLICIYFISLIHSLKVLLFDKSLTQTEKKEIKSDLKPLLLVPVILGIILLFSKRIFITASILLGIIALLSVLLSGWRKNRKQGKQTDSQNGATELLAGGKEIADDVF